ncbi:tetratricopeptide repeat protein [Anaerophaga thermohalophila]|uniref:tetratricopeptide repeat protein n=1 Tax=Anaerophaga thermohalophila TaxID=177400 RepID=UPI0002EC24ED|nr:tetratricopeptide repeat protein [Anaerophaga thermohalophila]
MGRMRLIDLVSAPEMLDEQTLETLKEVLDTYPFFQAGRMLWIKNLHKLDHIRFNSELKLAAAYIPDRSKLFFLINDVFSSMASTEKSRIDGTSSDKDETADQNLSAAERVSGDQRETPSVEILSHEQGREEADHRSSSLELIVGDDANYFEVDDTITSANGEQINFSGIDEESGDEKADAEEEASGRKEHNPDLVLPAADLLDYEKEAYSSAYSLESEVSKPPVDFNENHSFSEWLYLLRHQPVDKGTNAEKEQTSKSKQGGKMELIDNFLNNAGSQTRIVPSNNNSVSDKDFSVKSFEENDDLMTETLANIHIKQGRYQKAIEIFERLRLKYPEKSVYFAGRIEEMEELINKQ